MEGGKKPWIQKSFALKMNFEGNPEGCCATINEWISETTKGKIKDMLQQGTITSVTRFVLANAIYFKGSWKDKFDKNETNVNGVFHTLSRGEMKVSMMHQKERFPLAQFADLNAQALKIPFEW